jgi:HlyD family secretion protein
MPSRGVLLLTVGLACARSESAPRQPAAAQKGGELVVRRGDFERVLVLTGEIDAVTAASLKVPRVPQGKVTIRSLALEGTDVKKGEVVAELDSSAFVTQVKERLLQLNQAEIDLERVASQNGVQEADRALEVESRRAGFRRAEIDADVPEGILPKRDYLEKQLAARRAKVELEKAEEALATLRKTAEMDLAVKRLAVEKLRRTVKAAEESIAQLMLRAPADGTVILGEHYQEGRKLQEADDVFMGWTVARVSASGARRVRSWLSDVDDGRVAVGMPARVFLDAYPGRQFEGEIVEMAPVARAPSERSQRRMFQVMIELRQGDVDVLRPGLSARAEVVVDKKPSSLLVPRVAVDLQGTQPKVTLASGGSAEIRLGGCSGEVCVVSSGLEEGARVRRVTQ